MPVAHMFIIAAAILAGTGVGFGAFGAHALSEHFSRFPDLQDTYQTAAQYHMYHALGLLGVAWAAERWPGNFITWSGILLVAGVLIFSGSLYILSLTGLHWLGAITPIGGVAFLAGWLCLAIGIWRT